jgi:hypothetical protein
MLFESEVCGGKTGENKQGKYFKKKKNENIYSSDTSVGEDYVCVCVRERQNGWSHEKLIGNNGSALKQDTLKYHGTHILFSG